MNTHTLTTRHSVFQPSPNRLIAKYIACFRAVSGLGFRFRALVVLCLALTAHLTFAQESGAVAHYTGTLEPSAGVQKPTPNATKATPTANVITFNAAIVGVAASSAQTLTANFAVSGYSGSFTPTAELHHGLNFSLGAVTCSVTGSSENCAVPVKFVPIYPGGRKDAIFLMDGTTRLATVLLGGVGEAPFAFTQTASSIVSSTPFPGNYIYKSITDEDGTLYVLNSSFIGKVTPAGVASQILLSGNPYIYDFALDGAGMLYVATSFGSQLITYDTVQGTQGTITLPSSDYWYPVAASLSGSYFVVNQDTQKLFEFKPDGTNTSTPINPSVNQDYHMAIDAEGDAFISGYTINEIPITGTQTEINSVGATDGVDVDAAKTVYATRYSPTGGVAMLAASDYSTPLTALDAHSSPLGVSVGPDGTVNVSNYTTLDVIDRSHSTAAIDFGEVDAGTTSSAQAGAIYNGGNLPLSISDFTFNDSAFSLEYSKSDDCAASIQVAPGAVCQIVATFTPTHPGVYVNTITVYSNSLNASRAISMIDLKGTSYGIYDVPSPATLNFGSQNTNTSVTKTVTLTNNGYFYASTIYSLTSDTVAIAVDQGTCASPLAVGSTCQLNVTFAPTAVQTYSGTVTVIAYVPGSGQPNQTFTFAVTGTGKLVTPATPVFSPAAGTYSGAQTVTLTDSTSNATIYYTTDGTTPTTSSTQYATAITVAKTETIKAIASLAGGGVSAVSSATYTIQLPNASVTPTSVSFGNQIQGTTSAAKTATLKNSGQAGLQITSIAITGANASNFAETDNCGTSLAVGASCTLSVTFTPATAASYSAAVTITSNTPNSPNIIALSGTGVAPVLSATPVLSPGTGTYNSNQSVTIGDATPGAKIYYTTDGSAPTTASTLYSGPIPVSQTGTVIQAIAAAAGDANSAVASATYTLQAATPTIAPAGGTYVGAQAVTLATQTPGATIEYAINFTNPPVTYGIYTGPITISSTTNLQAIATLSGYLNSTVANANYVIQLPAASVSPSSLGFGSQTVGTASLAKTATLKNTGTAPLQITGIALTGSDPSDFTESDNCGTSLAAGGSCALTLTFTPADTVSYSAAVTIASNASTSPTTIALSGTGTAVPVPVASLSPSSLGFTSIAGTATAAQVVTLKNTGNAALSIAGVTLTGTNPSDFTQTNNCGTSVAAGTSCAISVIFTPSSAGSFSATLSVSDNASGSPQTAALTGTGTAPAQGEFTISATPSSVTVAAGGSAEFQISVGTTGGPYSKEVTLSASGLPTGATATFTPASVTPGSGTATSTLTIQTAAATAANTDHVPLWPAGSPALALLFFTIPMQLRKRWSRRVLLVLLMLVSLSAAAALIGCGGHASHRHQPTTKTITITATSGSDAHTTTVQLTTN